MALFLDRNLRLTNTSKTQRVRVRMDAASFEGIPLAHAIELAHPDVLKKRDERGYSLRILTDPEEL